MLSSLKVKKSVNNWFILDGEMNCAN